MSLRWPLGKSAILALCCDSYYWGACLCITISEPPKQLICIWLGLTQLTTYTTLCFLIITILCHRSTPLILKLLRRSTELTRKWHGSINGNEERGESPLRRKARERRKVESPAGRFQAQAIHRKQTATGS